VPGEPQLLRLRIPLLPSDAAVEVRLVAPDGRRALVERFDAPDGPVALRVPRSWLGAGTHRLEIRTPEGGRDLPLEVPAALSDPSTPLPGSGE